MNKKPMIEKTEELSKKLDNKIENHIKQYQNVFKDLTELVEKAENFEDSFQKTVNEACNKYEEITLKSTVRTIENINKEFKIRISTTFIKKILSPILVFFFWFFFMKTFGFL